LVVALCPECRSVLDRVADLTDLIGLRLIPFVDDPDGVDDYLASGDEPTAAAIALPDPTSGSAIPGRPSW
jgi:hypothetical protein